MKKYQSGLYIPILYLIMAVLWTIKNIRMGEFTNSVIGIGMTLFGCAEILFLKDKNNKIVDAVVIVGIILWFVYYLG